MKRLVMILATLTAAAALATDAAADVQEMLGATGHVVRDSDNDGFTDAGPGTYCNPAGYVELHPFSWRLNRRWALYHVSGPALLTALPSIDSTGGGWETGFGYPWFIPSWPDFDVYPWPSPSGFDFGIHEGVDVGEHFGIHEAPTVGSVFGVDEGTVPEPAAAALLACGGVALVRRRRK